MLENEDPPMNLWGAKIQDPIRTSDPGTCWQEPGPRSLTGSKILDPVGRTQDLGTSWEDQRQRTHGYMMAQDSTERSKEPEPYEEQGPRTLHRSQDPMKNKDQEFYREDAGPYEDFIERMQNQEIWEYPMKRYRDLEGRNLWESWRILLRRAGLSGNQVSL